MELGDGRKVSVSSWLGLSPRGGSVVSDGIIGGSLPGVGKYPTSRRCVRLSRWRKLFVNDGMRSHGALCVGSC